LEALERQRGQEATVDLTSVGALQQPGGALGPAQRILYHQILGNQLYEQPADRLTMGAGPPRCPASDPRTAPAAGWERRPPRAPPAVRSQGSGHGRAAAWSAGIAGSGRTGCGRPGSPPDGSRAPRLGGNPSLTGGRRRSGPVQLRLSPASACRTTSSIFEAPLCRRAHQPDPAVNLSGGPGGGAGHHSRSSPTRDTRTSAVQV
jgi:hypothetical protein